ncbi:hypothetical protein [Lacinutrix sp. MEBiC02595]
MNVIKKNFGWVIVTILASLPLLVIFKMINIDFSNGLSLSFAENAVG